MIMETIKERPIIFNTEMVKAILDDRKTQTRRVIKPQPINPTWTGTKWVESGNDNTVHYEIKCPHGKIGEHLWVRETFSYGCYDFGTNRQTIHYRADGLDHKGHVWSPSIHMFRKYSRIDLEITDIRVERVQDISWEDLLAEGYPQPGKGITKESLIYPTTTKMKQWFVDLWDSSMPNEVMDGKLIRGYG